MKALPKTLWVFLLMSFFSAESSGTKSFTEAPNVIIVVCDDLNDAIHGMGGHPQAITPNIDKLVDQGIRFTNAQCNAPLCGPSRASLWSGLYPHTTGYFGYNQQQNHWRKNKVLRNAVTIFEHFSQHGYQVFATGKIHHNGHEDKSIFINEDGSNGFNVEASFGPYPWDSNPETAALSIRGVRHPDFPENYQNFRWTEGFGKVEDISKAYGGKGSWLYDHWGKEYHVDSTGKRDLMPDENCTEYAISVLKQEHKKPFFLAVGFNRPHSPQYVPAEYFDLFDFNELILSPSLKNDLDDCGVRSIESRDIQGVNTGRNKYDAYMEAGGPDLIKKWTHAYLASVAFIDDQLGKILHALNESAYSKNTIVIFTSDHGYHMGEKGLIFKNTTWEESSRVPLVITGPGIDKLTEINDPVSLIDIYPTLLEYCGLPESPNKGKNNINLDGSSLIPFFKYSTRDNWKGPDFALTAVCSQENLNDNEPGPVEHQHYSVRSERFRYILYRNGEEELYDHKYDPFEWFNLASDPVYFHQKIGLKENLLKEIKF